MSRARFKCVSIALFWALGMGSKSFGSDPSSDSFELSSDNFKVGSQYKFRCTDEKGSAVEVLKTLKQIKTRKPAEGSGTEVVISTRTEQGGRLNNAKERLLWQIFSLSFIWREDRDRTQVGRVLGSVHPSRWKVGDHYHYQFQEIQTAKQSGQRSEVVWDVNLQVKKTEEIQWAGDKEKVFVMEEVRTSKSHPDEILTTYYSPRLNTDLRTNFRALKTWEYDCRLISQK